MNSRALLLILPLLAPGCATVQSAVCPTLPSPPVLEPAQLPYLPRMQTFLSGLPQKPTDYGLTSKSAPAGLKP